MVGPVFDTCDLFPCVPVHHCLVRRFYACVRRLFCVFVLPRVVHGFGWVGLGRYFSVFGGLGLVVSTTAKVLKFDRITLMHLKHS